MKKIYFMIVIIISLMALAVYSTYAMFTADFNIGQVANVTASSAPTTQYLIENEVISVAAYQSMNIDLNITNSTTGSLYYGVWYEMVDPTTINSNIKIGIGSSSANPAIGQIAKQTTKTVTVYIKNNTSSGIAIKLGVGYSSTNSLNLPTERTIISETLDNVAPTLSLTKETYLDLPFDNSWTYSAATVTDGVLSYDGTSTSQYYATSPYLKINNESYAMAFDTYLTNTITSGSYAGKYGLYAYNYYYDENLQATANTSGNTYAGRAKVFTTGNAWFNNQRASAMTGIQGTDIQYAVIKLRTSASYSVPPVKVRNFKVYGQLDNSFYYINVTSSDNVAVTTTKCAKGSHSKEYFKEHGTVVSNTQITVTENGTYTVYVEDALGNAAVDTIEITNINVPSEYQKVEYISSTGTQYIDSGLAPSTLGGNYRLEIGESHSSDISNLYVIGGAMNNTAAGARANIRINTATNCQAFVNNSDNSGNLSLSRATLVADSMNDIKFTVSTTNTTRKLEVNGSSTSSTAAFTSSSTTTWKVFGMSSYKFVGKLYYARIYDSSNDHLERDFVPVYRKSDGVIGLYDTANGVFYTNAGTGDFGKGTDVPAVSS